ncbi:hypothetical protein PDN14_15060 [Bacillus cereus group sp. Bc222]|uniref:hypothetical protein n=1 Tax=Bacillus cereus group sp. Bc222 TaxID=3018111 RepID=UPI0022E2B3EC|nr:hypothetical protein [Bacillus cereus group sp. Bc222]MDA2239796.1 hypothetical protein [Bacillus cereus group sp. Bc222]
MIRKIEIFLADVLFLISINCAIISGRLMRHGDAVYKMERMRNNWLKTDAFKLREESWQGYCDEEEEK